MAAGGLFGFDGELLVAGRGNTTLMFLQVMPR